MKYKLFLISLILILFSSFVSGLAPDDDLLGHFQFEDSSNSMKDSHSVSDVSLSNSGSTNASGYEGSGRYCDGSNDRITTNNLNSITNYNKDWSINFWYKADSSVHILSRGDGGSGSVQHMVSTSIYKITSSADSSADWYDSFSTPSLNVWHMYTLAFDKDDGGEMCLYLDGSLEGCDSSGTLADFYPTHNPSWCGPQYYAEVYLDEISYWGRTLNSDNVSDIYSNGISYNEAPEFGLFEVSNSLPVFSNDVVDLKFNVSDADDDNLSFNISWFSSSDNSSWTAHTSDDESWVDEDNDSYVGNEYHTSSDGDLEASDLDAWEFWKASGIVSDGSESYSVNSSVFLVNNLPVNITGNSSGSSSSDPVDKGGDVFFNVSGFDNEEETVYLKVCDSSDDNWSSCDLLCQDSVGVVFDSSVEKNISCSYTSDESVTENVGYGILWDGGNYSFVNISYFVNQFPVLQNFTMQDTSGGEDYFFGESIDFFRIDVSDVEDASPDVFITLLDPSSSVVIDNVSLSVVSGNTVGYESDYVLNDVGNYSYNIYVVDDDGAVSWHNDTFVVDALSASDSGRLYAYDFESLPSYDVVHGNFSDFDYYVVELRINRSSDWSELSSVVGNMKNASELAVVTLSDDLSNVSATLDFVSDNYADLIGSGLLNGVRALKLFVEDGVVENASNSGLINNITRRIFQNVSNKFPIYVRNYNHSDLNDNYAGVDDDVYITADTDSDYLSTELGWLRNNSDKTRYYFDLDVGLKEEVLVFQTDIFNKMRSTINGSTSYSDDYVAELVNGDLIVVNTGASEAVFEISTVDVSESHGYSLTRKEIVEGDPSSAVNVTVGAESAVMVYFVNLSKLVVDSNDDVFLYSARDGMGVETHDLSSGSENAFLFRSGASSANPDDGRIILTDPSFEDPEFYVWYGTSGAEAIGNWSKYDIVIMADDSNETWVGEVANVSDFFGYASVEDYGNNNYPEGCTAGVDCTSWNRSYWLEVEKESIDDWTDIQDNVHVFVDGLDIAEVNDVDGLFGDAIVELSDYVMISKGRDLILNTYTSYEDYANLGDYTMRESACSRWDLVEGEYVYSYEDIDLELERANFHRRHGIPVLAQAFGEITDYDRAYYCYMQTRVLYGDLAKYSFNQPNFDYTSAKDDFQWNYFKYPELGSALEDDYSEVGTNSYSRRFENGVVTINTTSNTVEYDNNDLVENIRFCSYFYDNDDGESDEGYMHFVINDNLSKSFDVSDENLSAFSKTYMCANISEDYYEPSGFYEIEFYYLDNDGTYLNNDGLYMYHGDIAGEDRLSFWDQSLNDHPVNDETDYTSYGTGDNWAVNFTIEKSTSDSLIDDVSSQISRSVVGDVIFNVSLSSSSDWNVSVFDRAQFVNKTNFNGISVNDVDLNVSLSGCDSDSPLFENTTVDGKVWRACQYEADEGFYVKVVAPDIIGSPMYVIDANTPPNISLDDVVLNNLLYGNQSWSLVYNVSDVEGDDISSCTVLVNNDSSFDGSFDGSQCSVGVESYANASDVWFLLQAEDERGLSGNGSQVQGFTIEFSELSENYDLVSNSSHQYVYKTFNLSSFVSSGFEDILWSRNLTDENTSVDLPAGVVSQANKEFVFSDLISFGDYGYVASADGRYEVDNPEILYKIMNLTYVNESELGVLPSLRFGWSPEVVDGFGNQSVSLIGDSELNITSGSTIYFNLSSQGDGTNRYNITHLRKIIFSSNDSIDSVQNADNTRTYWWNEGIGKRINFLFDHPKFPINSSTTVFDNISYSNLTQWDSKLSYNESLFDHESNVVSSSFEDNVSGSYVLQEFDLVSGDEFYVYNLSWVSYSLYINESWTSPEYPRFGDDVLVYADAVDVDAGMNVSGYVNVTSPNSTNFSVDLSCSDDGEGLYSCVLDSSFEVDEYGVWNYTVYVVDNESVSNTDTDGFWINKIEEFNTSARSRSFGENITLFANMTGDIDNVTFYLFNRSNVSEVFINESVLSESGGFWNTSESLVLGVGSYVANMSAVSDSANQVLSDSFEFDVSDEVNIFPSEIAVAPDPRNESIVLNLSMFTNSYEDYNFTFDIFVNSSQINRSIADSWELIGLDSYNSTDKFFNQITLQVNDSFIVDGEYYGNVTVNRTFDNRSWVVPITIGVNPPAGRILVNETGGNECSGSLCNLNTAIFDNQATTKTWTLSNSGNYTLSSCNASIVGSDFDGLSSDYFFSDENFSINSSEVQNLTLTISEIPSGTYYGELEIVCSATSYGYLDRLSSRSSNVPKISFLTVLPAPEVPDESGTGGGGGSSTTEKIECDIDLNQNVINFDTINEFEQLIITNKEDFTYNPSLSFNSDDLNVMGTLGGILPDAELELTLRSLTSESKEGNLTLIDATCKDIVVPIGYGGEEVTEALDLELDDILTSLEFEIGKIPLKIPFLEKDLDFTFYFWMIVLFLFILFVILAIIARFLPAYLRIMLVFLGTLVFSVLLWYLVS